MTTGLTSIELATCEISHHQEATHLCPDISVLGCEDAYSRSFLLISNTLDIPESVCQLFLPSPLRVYFEKSIITEDDDMVITGWMS